MEGMYGVPPGAGQGTAFNDRGRRKDILAPNGSPRVLARKRIPKGWGGEHDVFERESAWGGSETDDRLETYSVASGNSRRSWKRETIHNEHNGVPVSSDDSSDDDDVVSRASRSSKMTIHQEANGIWVSSDDESDDDENFARTVVSEYNNNEPHMVTESYDRSYSSPLTPRSRYRRKNGLQSSSFHSAGYSSDYVPGSHDLKKTNQKPRHLVSKRPMALNPELSSSNGKNPALTSPASQWSSSSSTTARTGLTTGTRNSYWSSSGSEANSPKSIRKRHGWSPDGEFKSELQQPLTPHGRHFSRTYSGFDNQVVESTSMPNTPVSSSRTFDSSHGTATPKSQSGANNGFQLKASEFWDSDGSRAQGTERGVLAVGIAIAIVFFAYNYYIYAVLMLAFTALSGSYISTMYRLARWRKFSGIEQQMVFNEMYEIVEQVCTDTRMSTATGEMKRRLVCAGEVGCALARYPTITDMHIKTRFWVEACAHFRLTLRSGCHHLGNGKLRPNTLTSASLGMFCSSLPRTICPSCDNKIAIESKFPLKCE